MSAGAWLRMAAKRHLDASQAAGGPVFPLSGFSVDSVKSVLKLIVRDSANSRSGRRWASSDYEFDERIEFHEASSKRSPTRAVWVLR